MTTRLVLAALHLLGLGIGLGSVWARARGFRDTLDAPGLRRLFVADTWWGVAAVLWIGTGLWRLLASTEKPTAYYLHNHVFWLKMSALVAILLLEIAPMVTLVKWRARTARGTPIDGRHATLFGAISYVQAVLVLIMVAAATAMARGIGA
jgi:putative membrane protein